MWQRVRVWLARVLTCGTDCTVIRQKTFNTVISAAVELKQYVERSGALQDSSRIHAWRRVYGLAESVEAGAVNSEVLP